MGKSIEDMMQDFSDSGIHEAVAKVVCLRCHSPSCCPDKLCPEVRGLCPGIDVIASIERTVKALGLTYMKQLLSDWQVNLV